MVEKKKFTHATTILTNTDPKVLMVLGNKFYQASGHCSEYVEVLQNVYETAFVTGSPDNSVN
jgi:hypothetical protein